MDGGRIGGRIGGWWLVDKCLILAANLVDKKKKNVYAIRSTAW